MAAIGNHRADYARWRLMVLAVRHLPDYKLRKLYSLGYTVWDIEHDRHYRVFPPSTGKARVERKDGKLRGRALSRKAIERRVAGAVAKELEMIAANFRLARSELGFVRQELERFRRLKKERAHK